MRLCRVTLFGDIRLTLSGTPFAGLHRSPQISHPRQITVLAALRMLTRRANWAMLRPVSEGDRRKRCGVEYAPGQPPVVAVFIDDAVLRETVGAILEDAGYRVWRLPADPRLKQERRM